MTSDENDDKINSKEKPKNSNPEENNVPLFHPDYALIEEQEDLFNHADYVDVLEYIIKKSETPLNIALYGRWGVGKSTMLNFLQKRIEKKDDLKKEFQFVYIDAWKLSESSIRQELLMDLNRIFNAVDPEEIEDKLWNVRYEDVIPTKDFKKWLKNVVSSSWPYVALFGAILGGGYLLDESIQDVELFSSSVAVSVLLPLLIAMIQTLGHISKSADRTSKRIIPRMESTQEFDKLFNQIVSKRKKPKLIIAIDNLDRCEDEVVIKILGTIKSFMNVENIIYIIPCDESAIIKHLKQRRGQFMEERDAIEFLTKFFQVTLSIPPQIEGDLGSYADKEMSKFQPDIKLSESVKDVLISGITKNPRKVRQFVYNIVAAYKLADAKEKKGVLQKETVTGNTAFLAKMIVLKDQWPEFYRELETRENLIELMQEHLDGNVIEPEDVKYCNSAIAKNQGLEYFLKSTNMITTANIQPFIRLNQESFESAISELDNFVLQVNRNNVSDVKAILSKLESDKKTDYVRKILHLCNDYVRTNRIQFAFHSLNVLLEIYDDVPSETQNEIFAKLETYLRTRGIRESLQRFDIDKLFPLVMKMSTEPQSILLKEYCRVVEHNIKLREKILQHFIDVKDNLPTEVIQELKQHIKMLGQSSPEELDGVIRFISRDNDASEKFLSGQPIDELISRIDAIKRKPFTDRIEIYLSIKNSATPNNKTTFLKKILTFVANFRENELKGDAQTAFDILNKLEVSDFPPAGANSVYETIVPLLDRFANENHKISVISIILKVFSNMNEGKKKGFAEKFLSKHITSGNEPIIRSILEQAAKFNAPILKYDPLMDNIVSRLSGNPINDSFVSYLITLSPEDRMDRVKDFIISCLKKRNPQFVNPTSSSFSKNVDKFSKEQAEEIHSELIQTIKSMPWDQAQDALTATATSISKAAKSNKDEFADICLRWMLAGDANQSNKGLDSITKSTSVFSKEKKTLLKEQILSQLDTLGSRNDQNSNRFFKFISNNRDSFENKELERLSYIIIRNLNSGQPEIIQLTLTWLPKMKLEHKGMSMLKVIFDVAKKSNDSVKNKCKEALKNLNGYDKSEEFTKEVNQLFSEEILK
ncbi:MAG: KAP family NTPase [Nitrosopumilus sp.]|uniref:KAP family P-loop NTPase fold protein n=1 Tax=Nitrosopumilus sp. TaxID=2024843 RepID=UPI00243057E9|nr:P-loop NTPase fold protein [Nitrosopumilus sp.]MCV0366327.1 KAP family NTPase [Nitrosopumilus sp.]